MNRVFLVLYGVLLLTLVAWVLWMTLKPLLPFVAVAVALIFVYRLIFRTKSW